MSEELKPMQDVPVAEVKAEGQKLEWGPELGRMSWYDAKNKIAELNAVLSEGDKSWRLPTKVELIAEFEGMSIQEAKLEYSERQKLPASAFCGPNKTYPAQDVINVKKSLTKLSQFGNKLLPAVKSRIEEGLRIRAKRFGIEVNETKIDRTPLVNWYLQECGLKPYSKVTKKSIK
jgi:hypothetical protein